MSIEQKPNKWLLKALLPMLRTYINIRSKIVIEQNDTIGLKPPYIILSNHVNNWDPIFINSYVEEPICFVAADPLFRHPLLGRVLNYVGAIPKTKFKSDTGTIRNILKAKKNNRVIGIFPEGNRNWDGDTEPFSHTTAKLVQSLKIPVVVATIKGGYLSHPRWAHRHRKGEIAMSFTKVMEASELSNLSVEKIEHILRDALKHDEMQWQLTTNNLYQGKQLANYLERFLFICPHCQTPGKLYSEDDMFHCHSCDYSVRYTPAGTFQQIDEPVYYKNPRDWNIWQLEYLKHSFYDANCKKQWTLAMKDHVNLYVSEHEQPFRHIEQGDLTWVKDGLAFHGDKGSNYLFALNQIEGLNIQLHHKLDFFYEEQFYRIEFYQPHTSAYKWLKVMHTELNQTEANKRKEAE